MTTQFFQLSITDHVARLSFNRPEKANALHLPAWEEMQQIFAYLDQQDEVRVIILSGNGKHFCSGIDLELLMSIQQFQQMDCEGRKREALRRFILKLQDTVTAIEKCSKPVIAAVHGACMGGGLDILAACDLRYCTEDAYFSLKEIDLGMVADLGSIQRLPSIIGMGLTAELAYTAGNLSAGEAQQAGLVTRTFADREQLLAGVNELAGGIAAKSPLSIRGIKSTLLYARDHAVPDALQQIGLWNAAMFLSSDLEEAFRATMEKRPPEFKD